MKNKTKKLKIKSAENLSVPHTNFAEEIYQQERTDKFLDRTFNITCIIVAILGIILLIVNLTR